MATAVADGDARIIDITTAPDANGEVALNIVDDLYEKLKDDWRTTVALQRSKFPFRSFGDSQGTAQIGPYIFFENRTGWRIRPYDADHTLRITGNLVPESAVEGTTVSVFVARSGRTITIREAQSAQALTLDSGLIDQVVEPEGGYSLRQTLNIMLSVLAGRTTDSGATFMTPNGAATRVAATLNIDNERTNMEITPG